MRYLRPWPLFFGSVLVLASFAAAPLLAGEAEGEDLLLGQVTRAELEAHEPLWVGEGAQAEVDVETASALALVPPGARVDVYLGTWCSDSAQEIPRLWRALDETFDSAPFVVRYVAVDREMADPAGEAAAAGVTHVPTFVVSRQGEELGRVVESAPHGIERDLHDLLTGRAAGFLSATVELAEAAASTVE